MYYVTAGCVVTGEGTCEKHFRIYNFQVVDRFDFGYVRETDKLLDFSSKLDMNGFPLT